jgi:hypothetical protein
LQTLEVQRAGGVVGSACSAIGQFFFSSFLVLFVSFRLKFYFILFNLIVSTNALQKQERKKEGKKELKERKREKRKKKKKKKSSEG